MEQQDYSAALEYLLDGLRRIQAADIVNEINQRIRLGKTRSLSAADLEEKNIRQKDVGTTQTLPLTPKEAFEEAISFLKSIVVEVPRFQQKIRSTFGEHIIWISDQNEMVETVLTNDKFSLEDITFSNQEVNLADNEFQKIKGYISE
jgi:hypothetical protein